MNTATKYIVSPLVGLGLLLVGVADSGGKRLPPPYPVTCTDAEGHILYTVDVYRVTGPQGQFLGTCKNGEVRDSSGRLLAHHGDAGLLYKFVASGHTP
jgi:hypothetical protein